MRRKHCEYELEAVRLRLNAYNDNISRAPMFMFIYDRQTARGNAENR